MRTISADGSVQDGVSRSMSKSSKRKNKSDFRLVAWSLISVIMNVGMVVSLVKVGLRIPNYTYFTLSFGCFLFNFPFFAYCYLNHALNKTLTDEMRAPIWKLHLFIMGAFVAFNGLFIVFANPHVPGPLQTMLLQGNIPITMVLCVILLGTKYAAPQYVGAAIVIGGVVVSLIPDFSSDSSFKGNLYWDTIFFLGAVPGALNNIYQEWAFRNVKMDIGYLMAWTNVGQFLALVLMFPFNAVHHFGTADTVADVATQYSQALACFFTGANQPGAQSCEGMWLPFITFVLFYVGANFSNAATVKYGNAVYSILVSIASTVLAELAFSQAWIMGDQVQPVNKYDWIALALIVVGVVIYKQFALDETMGDRSFSRADAGRDTDVHEPLVSALDDEAGL